MTRDPAVALPFRSSCAGVGLVLGLAVFMPACGTSNKGTASAAQSMTSTDGVDKSRCSDSGKQVVTLDTNQDEKPDVWKLYVKGSQGGQEVQILACRQTDLNHDGHIDAVFHFDDAAVTTLEEFDLDFDGKFEMRSIYQGGKRIRDEMDMNFDNRPDITRFFEGGRMVREEIDTNNDGRPDQFVYYENGKPDRIGYDTTGSGRVDKWERSTESDLGAAATAAAAPVAPTAAPPAAVPPAGAK